MKVSMTNAEALRCLNSLRELESLNNPVSAVAGYRIVQNIHALINALAPYQEIRDKTIKKHAKNGVSVDRKTDPEAFDACTRDLAEVERLTIDVEVKTFPIDMIADCKLPIHVLFALNFMLEKDA